MHWPWIVLIIYVVVLILVCLRIIYETRSSTKTMAYLLFCIFAPVVGIVFYLTFGVNYWKKKLYSKKTSKDYKMLEQLKNNIPHYSQSIVKREDIKGDNAELASMLIKDIHSPLTRHNSLKLLLNGEEKFPELLQCLSEAKHHIHIEYYIYEDDEIGTAVIELLIKKAKEGVQVRFIYDDFGSPGINNKIEKRMKEAGIEIHPFHKVHFYLLANRLNYRNHRKIVVVDGQTGFVGGINVSDKYINDKKKGKLYWRDTHLRIDGPGVYYLQYLFLADWNFCCAGNLKPENIHFPENPPVKDDMYVQIVGSGPDSAQPSVLFSILEAIYLAKKEILITTPYFIPGDNIIDALRIAATSGLSVKLLVPGKSDSKFVNFASRSYYDTLLQAGVEIYTYEKGFVHAKTLVTDGRLSMIGTSNMDYRSFELNFEVNAIVYDKTFAEKMRKVFFDDLESAKKLNPKKWHTRPIYKKLLEKIAALFSPAL